MTQLTLDFGARPAAGPPKPADAAPHRPANPRNEHQRRAADPAASVWVGASAGTGKTSVLTDRVLRLMLAGTAPERILCLTFTKAGAAEMANRIARTLADWAAVPDAVLQGELEALTGEPLTGALETRARQLFARVLDAPGGLKIQTIHGFCQSLLRRFPIEAGLAPQFDLLDERGADDLLEQARRDLLATEDPVVGGALRHLTATVAQEAFAQLMTALVAMRGRIAELLAAHDGLPGLRLALRRTLGLRPTDTTASITEEACGLGCDEAALRRAVRALDRGRDSDQLRAATIAAWLDDPETRAAGLRTYVEAFHTLAGARRKKLITVGAARSDPGAEPSLQAEAERLLAVRDRLRSVGVAEATEALLALGATLIDGYAALKAHRALLDFEDLILGAAALLRAPGRSAWVLWKLDGGIDHLLIDEAQDTSPAQWHVVAALTEDFFAGLGAQDRRRTVFVVGDEKQSIFSFQGADPAEFDRMRSHFASRLEASEERFETLPLAVSFRSVRAVLETVDAVFAGDGARDGVAAERFRHVCFRKGEGGLVELWPPIGPEPGDTPPPWEPPTTQRGISDPAAKLADLIARRIRGWLDAGELLEARGRPIEPGDILVLVRTRNRFFVELVRALKARDVPVAGVDRMILTEQLAVMDMLALGRFLLLPEDDLSLAEVLKGPLAGFDDDRLFALAHGRRGTLWSALAAASLNDPAAEAVRAWLAGLLARVDYAAPFELFGGVLASPCPADPVSGRRAMLGRLGPEAEDPLDELLALALSFERILPPSLERFLAWLAAGEAEVKRENEPGGPSRVRIMTVHGAKGLEAPVVFLPDTMAMPEKSEAILWPDDEVGVPLWAPRRDGEDGQCTAARQRADRRRDQEYRRLLYVALTRAADRLYICGHHGPRPPPRDCWYNLCYAGLWSAEHVETIAVPGLVGPGLRLLEPQTRRVERRLAPLPTVPPAPDPLPAWARRPAPDEPEPSRPLTPSRPDGDDPPVRSPLDGDDRGRFRRGSLIHALLQHLPRLPQGAREAAARRFVAQPQHGRDPEEQAEIVATTLAVLDTPGFASLFSQDSRAEVPVAGLVEGRAIAGQIDRLVVTPDSVLIVDYKTNRPPPASEAATAPAYLAQMAAYRAALRLIYPGRRVSCAILWTEGPRLMPLSDATLDRHAPGAGRFPA